MTTDLKACVTWLDRHPSYYWWLSALWLILLCTFAFGLGLGGLGLTDKTEALFVEVARQMVETGDWITPRWNGEVFFDYPVWGYWMVGLSFKIFGFHGWAARLPSALTAITVVIAVFFLMRFAGKSFGETSVGHHQIWFRSWVGSGMMALNPGWLGWGRMAVTDMYLSSAIALSLLCFFGGYCQFNQPKRQSWAFMLTAAFAAIAFLAKGPIGVLLPGLVIFGFLLYVGQFKTVVFQETPWLRMVGIFLIITAPWYLLAFQTNGMEFLGTFFGFSNFQRFMNVLYRHAGPWYFYLPWCGILLLPWSLFLPLAVARLQIWRRRAWVTSPRDQQLGLFCAFWLIFILLFFSSAATKLAGYILPLVPAGVILTTLLAAELWVKAGQSSSPLNRWPFLTSLGLNTFLLMLMAIAAYLSPQLVGSDPATPQFEALLKASGLPLLFSGILGLGAIACGILLFFKSSWRQTWCLINIMIFLLVLMLVIPPLVPLLDSQIQKPSRLTAIAAQTAIRPGESLLVMGYKRYSVVYYSQHPAIFLDDVHYAWEMLKQEENTQQSGTVLLIGEKRTLDRFHLQPGDYQEIQNAYPYHLWRVNKQTLLQRQNS